ncbi:MAG: NusG domain II-containing protein [Elusimicrobia bacterium]|nr:NusG domain II-containing protein [Elusimicrobiota bacterium]
MTAGDRLIIFVVLAFALVSGRRVAAYLFQKGMPAGTAVVWFENKMFGEFDLSGDRIITVRQGVRLQIKDRTVKVFANDCPQKSCIHQGDITSPGGKIICLPNKLLVELKPGRPVASRPVGTSVRPGGTANPETTPKIDGRNSKIDGLSY